MSLRRQKPTAKTDGGNTNNTITPATAAKKSDETSTSPPNCCTACLTKLKRKLKRKGKMLLAPTGGRQSSFQCRYDPLSYSLNFDGGACGTLSGCEEDYYLRFYAFSSRFAANKRPTPCETIVTTSH